MVVALAALASVTAIETIVLGEAENYAILSKTGISTVPDSVITGDIAVSPITGNAMTGFSMTMDADGTKGTSEQVTGIAYAASYIEPTPTWLTTAVLDMQAAYTDAAGRPNENDARINLGAGILGGVFGGPTAPLMTGVYTFDTDVHIVSELFFDGEGKGDTSAVFIIQVAGNILIDANLMVKLGRALDGEGGKGDTSAVFIIQVAGNILIDANLMVKLRKGASAKNIFWQVSGNVKVMSEAHMEGNILCKTDVTFITGSSLNGRILAQTAAVLQKATITKPAL
eukprot:CAMPEP_0171682416 /NCGR_PEP_ID=MMETSP0991-20121206/516_1 /TAXON_ID=483369 /ORGANISM="non described non described, Strain CCMP2098" /LENGTH=283 /DNA_ID=CAMNT_0012269621 /DNA_START=496 /DNA_END=1348 /DNA_ORIENTATION=-